MQIEGYLVVVDNSPWEDGDIWLGRGGRQDATMIKLYIKEEDAEIAKRSVLGNGDGDNVINIYKVSFDLPEPRPTEVTAKVEKHG